MNTIETRESNVRAYCRDFPALFVSAKGATLRDDDGNEYIDFLAGAGALNYGHNPDAMKKAMIAYLEADGVTHSLDMATAAKTRFIERFDEIVLEPRGMNHKLMFPGPTGTNAVESALKLARKVTGRSPVVAFTSGFHGMTLGALAATSNDFKRRGAGIPLGNATILPYDGYLGADVDSLAIVRRMIEDAGSGVDMPAAMIVETVQGEGGLNTASDDWLRGLAEICRRWEILLIIDDIQAGCGRTGTFFSFEPAGIDPDIVCLSKSIGGYGLPMAVNLIKPEHDWFEPGEHNGTFRGNNLAFVAATEALEFWRGDAFRQAVEDKARRISDALDAMIAKHPELDGTRRGRGLMQGIAVGVADLADEIKAAAFARGLILETSGPESEVLKVMPPLVIENEALDRGLAILDQAVVAALEARADEKRKAA